MRRKLFISCGTMLFVASSVFLGSCANDMDEPMVSESEGQQTDVISFDDAVVRLMDEVDRSKSGYLTHNSTSGENLVFSGEDYELYSAFAEILVQDKHKAPPANQGWKYVGKGKTKIDALAMARTLSKTIGEGVDFEIHVEQESDGYWYLWYRIV